MYDQHHHRIHVAMCVCVYGKGIRFTYWIWMNPASFVRNICILACVCVVDHIPYALTIIIIISWKWEPRLPSHYILEWGDGKKYGFLDCHKFWLFYQCSQQTLYSHQSMRLSYINIGRSLKFFTFSNSTCKRLIKIMNYSFIFDRKSLKIT
mgnify:CR=1 FL=1